SRVTVTMEQDINITTPLPQNYKIAPEKVLPTQQFFAVEYPGNVINTEKALQTLGGQRGLKKAVNEDLLELRFRPNNPFCHPINGDIIPTANLLLKVTRRRKKVKGHHTRRDSDDEESINDFNFDIMGIIRMADYQYVPNPNDSIPRYMNALENFDINTILDFESLLNDERDEDNLPPPSFSRIECPTEYGYRQNMAVVKVLVQKGEGQAPALKLINRSQGPPPDVVKPAYQPSPESAARIKKLFAERPIWTRLALMNNLPACDRRSIKMQVIANGCIFDVKWSLAGFYQATDIRNNRRPVRLERAKRLLRVQADLTNEMDELSLLPENYIKTTHIFDGKTAERDVAIYQLCDVTDPLMRSIIDSPDSVQDICTERDGHYKRSAMLKMRNIMRKKFKALLEGTVIDDKEFEELLRDSNSENGDGGEEEEEEEEGDPSANRVEELMRDLQNAKDQVEGELMQDEEGNLYELDELNEYDDIFGENDSDFTEEE
ncbi:30502_t:CDS:10, partial [Gigaspora margarita]